MHRDVGRLLEEAAKDSTSEFVLVSAFIKVDALQRVVAVLQPHVRLNVFVRWRLEDIVAGASDLEIYELLSGRPGSTLWMCPPLHAKYYRNDQCALIGSANLTNAGLGWSADANLELLIQAPLSEATEAFEADLRKQAQIVDDSLVQQVREFLALLQPNSIWHAESPGTGPVSNWLPALRDPDMLYLAYIDDKDAIPRASQKAALQDLSYLRAPPKLSRSAFEAYVSFELRRASWVRTLEVFLQQPRRFGEVAQWLVSEYGVSDGKHCWQTLLRWLLKFLPDRFRADIYNYSEVASLR